MVKFLVQEFSWNDYLHKIFLENLGYIPEKIEISFDIWKMQTLLLYMLSEDETLLLQLLEKKLSYTVLNENSVESIRNIKIQMDDISNNIQYDYDSFDKLGYLINNLNNYKQCLINSNEYNILYKVDTLLTDLKEMEYTISNSIELYSNLYNSIQNVIDKENLNKEYFK